MKKTIHLEEFINNFLSLIEEELNYGEFLEELKGKYWLPGKEWLADALPWTEIKEYKIKPIKTHMLSDSMGLLVATFDLVPTGIISFSLLKTGDKWYLDWQNREVWLLATERWKRKNQGNLEIRYFKTFSEAKINSILEEIHEINEWIKNELGSNQEKLVIVFGYDAFEYLVSDTGNKPTGAGGNSRGKLILMCEDFPDLRNKTFESIYYQSILLHEMIHEYSCYDKLWKGSIDNMSLKLSLISEGVALYYQFKFFMGRIKYIQFDNEDSIVKKIKSGVMEAHNYREQILELLSNKIFTQVNRENSKAWNSAYFLGASLYNYFLQKDGFGNTRRLFSEIGNMEAEKAKLYIADYFNKEEYLTSSKDYFNNIMDKFHRE